MSAGNPKARLKTRPVVAPQFENELLLAIVTLHSQNIALEELLIPAASQIIDAPTSK